MTRGLAPHFDIRRAARKVPVGVGGEIGEHGEGGDVLAERLGIDLVERVVGGVVIVEIVVPILRRDRPRARRPARSAPMSAPPLASVVAGDDAERRELALDGAAVGQRGVGEAGAEAPDAAGAEIALGGDDVRFRWRATRA